MTVGWFGRSLSCCSSWRVLHLEAVEPALEEALAGLVVAAAQAVAVAEEVRPPDVVRTDADDDDGRRRHRLEQAHLRLERRRPASCGPSSPFGDRRRAAREVQRLQTGQRPQLVRVRVRGPPADALGPRRLDDAGCCRCPAAVESPMTTTSTSARLAPTVIGTGASLAVPTRSDSEVTLPSWCAADTTVSAVNAAVTTSESPMLRPEQRQVVPAAAVPVVVTLGEGHRADTEQVQRAADQCRDEEQPPEVLRPPVGQCRPDLARAGGHGPAAVRGRGLQERARVVVAVEALPDDLGPDRAVEVLDRRQGALAEQVGLAGPGQPQAAGSG